MGPPPEPDLKKQIDEALRNPGSGPAVHPDSLASLRATVETLIVELNAERAESARLKALLRGVV